jgi:hypothetical protein
MDTLDADILKELEQIYKRAATELRARIAVAGGTDGNIPLQQLQDVLGQVELRLHQLATERNALLENGLENAARFGAAPLTAAGAGVDAAAAMAAQPGTLLESDAAMRVSDEAVRFVRPSSRRMACSSRPHGGRYASALDRPCKGMLD